MKFEHTQVFNFEGAFRGLRNPMNSWDKSDSCFGIVKRNDQLEEVIYNWKKQFPDADDANLEIKLLNNGRLKEAKDSFAWEVAFIGPADMNLAQRLIKSGPEHRKFLRQIFVSVDITAPIYWWKEASTYKVATTANSTSTMHKLASQPITLNCFETDDFDSSLVYYKQGMSENTAGMLSEFFIEQLEMLRQKYLETEDKRYWKELVRWLPESWLQTRTWTANYETIRAMCQQRRNHKLTEWSGTEPTKESFIQWARKLPYAQWFIFDDEGVPFAQEDSIS